MRVRETFDDALNRAIDGLRSRRPLDAVLLDHPAHALALRPLLDTAALVTTQHASAVPQSTRLADNLTIVRAAVQRAQIAERAPQSTPRPRTTTPWWSKRRTVASLTLPLGVIAALALAGVGGAAAATVAVTGSDVPGRIAHAVTPDWVEQHVPGNSHASRDVAGNAGPTDTDGPVSETPTPPPGHENAPQRVTVSGVTSDIRGNVFMLTNSDGTWKVDTDANSLVIGTLADGATASVTGDATADKNLHALTIEVTAAPAGGGDTPPSNDPAAKTPGPPPDHTPGPIADKTPGPPVADTPPGHEATKTPPGQAGDGGDEGSGAGGDPTGANAIGGGNVKP